MNLSMICHLKKRFQAQACAETRKQEGARAQRRGKEKLQRFEGLET